MDVKDNSFSSFCRRIMEEKGISVSELARRCGLPRTMVSGYMNGYYIPKKTNRTKILEALGLEDDNKFMAEAVDLSHEIMSNGALKSYIEVMLHYYYVLSDKDKEKLIERAAELETLSKITYGKAGCGMNFENKVRIANECAGQEETGGRYNS